ncbi:MAG: alpha-galactosidase [Kiritimatiellae bacterium]|nr:alpha-galactosidase [Kiritimatiellia bacterium]
MNKFICAVVAMSCTVLHGNVPETELRLELPKQGEVMVQTVDPKGRQRVLVSFDVPASDIQQIWRPDFQQPFLERKWWLTANSSSMCDMPYMAFFNLAETNRLSIGAEALEWDCRISSKINQEKGVYAVTLTVAADDSGTIKPFKVTIDRRPVVWTEALADWRNSLSYGKGRYPEAAWKPVYCSWYAVHAALSQDWVERTGEIAAKLGFRTFILDDGWSYDESKRVNPESIKEWYRDVGKWDAFSLGKFPDFKAHRERMRAFGLKYLVWVSPYFIGIRSSAYTKWKDRLAGQEPFEGNVLTDVADAEMMESVTEQLVRLLKDADLDGLKIDFLDYIKPSVEKPRSGFGYGYVRNLMSRLKSVKPDGLFEFRQSYATPLTLELGTQFRAGDVPFEWLCNILRIAQIRLAVGDGVPVHADPIFWSQHETRDNIVRHFMAAMAGVPMVSMDLEKLPGWQKDEIARWMRIYSQRVEPFQKQGRWNVVYRNGSLAYVTSIRGNEALVIVVDSGASFKALDCALDGKRTIVMNLGYAPVCIQGTEVAPAQALIP